MMYPYAKFLIDFDQRHGSLKHRNSPSNTKAAVIIESRPLFFLPMVLKNLMFFLGGEWNLHIFSGELSEKYVDDIVDGWDVSVTKLEGLRHLSAAHRSEIMKTTQFWKLFPEEKLLIFESNCVACAGNIENFLEYDFIGAPVGTTDRFSFHGGFSLRSRQKMIECIVKGRSPEGEPEDEFFTRMMRQIGAVTPDFTSACHFAVSSTYEGPPVGVPATDQCLHPMAVADKILAGVTY